MIEPQGERKKTRERVSRKGNPYEQRRKSRSHGEGSIYFHESKKLWRATVTLSNGKRKYLSGKSRQDVARKLTVVLRDLQIGINPPDERQTFGPWLHQYVDGLEAQKVSQSTLFATVVSSTTTWSRNSVAFDCRSSSHNT